MKNAYVKSYDEHTRTSHYMRLHLASKIIYNTNLRTRLYFGNDNKSQRCPIR